MIALHKVCHPTFCDSTANEDYGLVNRSLVFTPGGNLIKCVNVSIINDSVHEDDEVFVVSLQILDGALRSVHVSVKIIDDDRK